MTNPHGSLAISAAVVFVGATVLIACGAIASRNYEFLMIPGFLIGVAALGAWIQAFREARQHAARSHFDESTRRAIEEYRREQGRESV